MLTTNDHARQSVEAVGVALPPAPGNASYDLAAEAVREAGASAEREHGTVIYVPAMNDCDCVPITVEDQGGRWILDRVTRRLTAGPDVVEAFYTWSAGR